MLLQLNALGSSLSLFCDHDNNLVGPLEGVVMAGSGPRLKRQPLVGGPLTGAVRPPRDGGQASHNCNSRPQTIRYEIIRHDLAPCRLCQASLHLANFSRIRTNQISGSDFRVARRPFSLGILSL
jgi:hypothetical protein